MKKAGHTYLRFIIPALVLVSVALPSYAQQVISIVKNEELYEIKGSGLAYLEDPDGKLTIDQVSSSQYREKFRNDLTEVPNFSYTRSAYWLRFTIAGAKPEREWLLEVGYALIDHVSLFVPGKDGYREKRQGQLLPYHTPDRVIENENFIFPLDIRPGETKTYFIRVDTEDSLAVPMRLMSWKAFSERSNLIRLFLGIFYGFIIVMVLYNAIVLIASRELQYLFLTLHLVSFIIFIMSENGMTYQYLWPGLPWWGKRVVPFSVSLVYVWSSLFARLFLQTRKMSPRLDKLILAAVGLSVVSAVLALTVQYFYAIIFSVLLVGILVPVLIVSAFVIWRKGYRPALSYLIAWTTLMTGGLVYGLKTLGFLPESMITKYGILVGASFQAMLLSVAMADKINVMTDSLRSLKNRLEQRTEFLLRIFEKAEAMSTKLSEVSTDQAEIVDTFSHVAQNQAAHAEEMAASFEELTSSTDSIDQSMAHLAGEGEKIRDMTRVLNTSQQEVKGTNDAVMASMKDIIRFTEKTDTDLTRMTEMMQIINEGGKAITNIISMIDDISDKINLLSLNAAIEAARAGDHGRGFAVVADEIGKLATATTDNSKRISSQIEKISVDIRRGIEIANTTKKSTSDVAALVGNINRQVDTVREAMGKQEHAIGQLVEQADLIKEQSKIISIATSEQKRGMIESTGTIQDLANMANDIATSNVKILQFIKILTDKAVELKGIVQNLDEA